MEPEIWTQNSQQVPTCDGSHDVAAERSPSVNSRDFFAGCRPIMGSVGAVIRRNLQSANKRSSTPDCPIGCTYMP